MVIRSLQQLIGQYCGIHKCEKAYQKQVVDFIIINHFLTINKYITFTSQKIAGNSEETKVARE